MGSDKSQLVFRGNTLLGHVVTRVATVAFPVVIAGAPSQPLAENLPAVMQVPDEQADCGPLEGIRVGLNAIADSVEFAFVVSCDVPLIRPKLILHLFELIKNHELVVPVQESRVFGMTAIYRTAIAGKLQELIARRKLRVQDLAHHFRRAPNRY